MRTSRAWQPERLACHSMNRGLKPVLMLVLALALGSCGEQAKLPVSAGIGPHPVLPAPDETFIPTVNVAPAVGWPVGAAPVAAQGMTVALTAAAACGAGR
jgi:hypothetical protein